jgi:hypothetical protein
MITRTIRACATGLAVVWCGVSSAQVLCSFETEQERAQARPGNIRAEVVNEHATDGEYALRCVFPGSEKDTWPGLVFAPGSDVLAGCEVLSFDVYNPQTKSVHLNYRIDDAAGNKEFGGTSLKPAAVTRVDLYLDALKDTIDINHIERVYPYIRMPREDVTLYFDAFRKTTLEADFTAMTYRHNGPSAEPGEADRARGYMLYSRHWMDVVFPTSLPRPAETPPQLRAFATPGEYEPMTVSVYALRELKDARVSVSDLESDRGMIASSQCRVYPVRSLNKRVTYSSNRFIRDMPVLLERRERVNITSETSRRFWIDVRVPDSTPAGVYTGTATFAADGTTPAEIPVKLRVLPFKLLPADDMIFGEYYRGPRMARTEEGKRAELVSDLRDMRDHGMTSVGLCMGVPTKQATLTEQGVTLNLDGTSLFELFMDTYRDLGFTAPIVILSDSGQAFAAQLELALMTPEYSRAYRAFWTAVQEECRRREWAELIVQPVDEPGWKADSEKQRNVDLLKLLKQIPGMRTEQDGPGDGYFHAQAGPYADIWNYNGAVGKPEQVAEAVENGHLIMVYNCDVEAYRPEVQRYMAGFFQKRAGIHGCYNWAYMSFSGSPYNDLDYKTGTWMHVYPEWEDEVGGPSIGWQGYREGIDDFSYMNTFRVQASRADAGGNADARAAAARGRAALKSFLDDIDYSPRVRSQARWTEQKAEQDGIYIGGTLKLPNGLDFHTYDLGRWQVAQATLDIMAALGDVAGEEATPETAAAQPPSNGVVGSVQWRTREPQKRTARPTSAYQVEIPAVDTAPVIDGQIAESAWKQGGRIAALKLNTGGAPRAQTRAWLLAHDNVLYLGIECDEEFVGQMTANVDEDGGALWQDDCIELFFDTNLDRSTFRQIIVNSLGRVTASDSSGASWSPAVRAAARVGADRWWVEVAIPVADLGLAQTMFGFNLCRERRPTEVLELSCWSPTGDRFGRPDRFGLAVLGASFFKSASLGKGVLGLNTFTATLQNRQNRSVKAFLALEWQVGDDPVQTVRTRPFGLAAGEENTVSCSYRLQRGNGRLLLRARLLDAQTQAVLAEQAMSQDIPSPLAADVTPAVSFLERDHAGLVLRLAVGDELRARGRLLLTISDAAGGRVLASQQIAPIGGDELSGVLDTSWLPAGSYRLRVRFEASGEASAEAEGSLSRVRGPFGFRK